MARLGGDEFAIVQSRATPTEASELAAQIIDALVEPFDVRGHQVIIGTSIGIALAPNDGTEPDQLLRNADMALYRAKAEGRGTYHFFQAGDGRPDAGAPPARARSAQGARRRTVRAALSAARQYRRTARFRASRRCCAGIIPSAAWSRPTSSFRSPRRRPDRAARRLGAQTGLPRRGDVAGAGSPSRSIFRGAVPNRHWRCR